MTGITLPLRGRRLMRVAAIYAFVAWVCVEVASVILPELQLPPWSVRFVIVLALLGFPLALVLAWVLDPPQPAEQPASAVELEPTPRSVAVLPFHNIGGDEENDYFCDGLAEELMITLSRARTLRVAARSSSFAFKDQNIDVRTIAERLGVVNVLEGSVRKSGRRLRIGVRLVDAARGYQLWAQTYDRELDDIFTVQDDIAGAVYEALRSPLGIEEEEAPRVRRGTDDVEAYNLYLMGRHQFHRRTDESLQSAIGFFSEAIERDPQFALPYSGLADAWLLRAASGTGYGNTPLVQAIDRAAPQVERALALDPQLAEAHASLGFLRRAQRDLPASEQALRRAIDLDPDYPMAHVWLGLTLGDQARLQEAYASHQRAYALDPLSPIVNTNLGFDHVKFGRLKEARECFLRVVEIDPRFPVACSGLAQLERQLGRSHEALVWIRRAIEISPRRSHYYCVLSAIHLDRGEIEPARSAMLEAEKLAREPNPVLAQYQFALAVATGALAPSRAAFEAGTSVGHDWAGAHAALGAVFAGDARSASQRFAATGGERLLEALKIYLAWGSGYPLSVYYACALGLVGRQADRDDWLDRNRVVVHEVQNQGIVGPELRYVEALIAALSGRTEQALADLEGAVEIGWHRRWWSERDPALAGLRDRSEFAGLLTAMLPVE